MDAIQTDVRAIFDRQTLTPAMIAMIISRRYQIEVTADDVWAMSMSSRLTYCRNCRRVTKLARAFMSHKDGCAVCARKRYAEALASVMEVANANKTMSVLR